MVSREKHFYFSVNYNMTSVKEVEHVMLLVHSEQCTLQIVRIEEGTFNFWAQVVTEHRKSL